MLKRFILISILIAVATLSLSAEQNTKFMEKDEDPPDIYYLVRPGEEIRERREEIREREEDILFLPRYEDDALYWERVKTRERIKPEDLIIPEDDDPLDFYYWERPRTWERVRVIPFKARSRKMAYRLYRELRYPMIGAGEEREKVMETFRNLVETWDDRGDKNKALRSIERDHVIVCAKAYKRSYIVIWWW